jgi:hypothetical protein
LFLPPPFFCVHFVPLLSPCAIETGLLWCGEVVLSACDFICRYCCFSVEGNRPEVLLTNTHTYTHTRAHRTRSTRVIHVLEYIYRIHTRERLRPKRLSFLLHWATHHLFFFNCAVQHPHSSSRYLQLLGLQRVVHQRVLLRTYLHFSQVVSAVRLSVFFVFLRVVYSPLPRIPPFFFCRYS